MRSSSEAYNTPHRLKRKMLRITITFMSCKISTYLTLKRSSKHRASDPVGDHLAIVSGAYLLLTTLSRFQKMVHRIRVKNLEAQTMSSHSATYSGHAQIFLPQFQLKELEESSLLPTRTILTLRIKASATLLCSVPRCVQEMVPDALMVAMRHISFSPPGSLGNRHPN